MSDEWEMPEQVPVDENDPRIQAAVAELQGMIASKFPAAMFHVVRRDDPEGIYLVATVDVEDLDEVTNVILERMVDMQVDDGLPIYVVPDWPIERVRAYLQQRKNEPAWQPPPILSWASD